MANKTKIKQNEDPRQLACLILNPTLYETNRMAPGCTESFGQHSIWILTAYFLQEHLDMDVHRQVHYYKHFVSVGCIYCGHHPVPSQFG